MMTPYRPDVSVAGKIRRRLTRLVFQQSARLNLDGPTVSFTFDDIPQSAALTGAPLLEAAGVRGTFYVCAGLFGREGHMGRFADADDIGQLAAKGHEIGCHTLDHLDCHRTPSDALEIDLDSNGQRLGLLDIRPEHFAYPYGEVSPRAKRLLAERFSSLRGVHKGLVHQGSDLNQLPAVGIEGPDGEATARRWIDRAIAEKAWLILYTHDVRDEPSPWGCTPATLERLIRYAQDQEVAIKPVGQVIAP